MIDINKIYNEDCLLTLSKMEDNSVDLVITSPPYNKNIYAPATGTGWSALRGRQIAYDEYNDAMPQEQYESWQKNVISECLRVLKPEGSLFYNHKDILYNKLSIVPKWVYDFNVHQQIIWERNGSPTLDPHYFIPVNEWIYWIVKDPSKTYFDRSKSIFKNNIWKMNFALNNPHPAPFPELMVGNIILCCSKENDLVYDPFMGSGTTALMAIKNKRNYIGSEISSNYVEMANKRLFDGTRQLSLF